MPSTWTPRAARGSAILPVPIASSSAGPLAPSASGCNRRRLIPASGEARHSSSQHRRQSSCLACMSPRDNLQELGLWQGVVHLPICARGVLSCPATGSAAPCQSSADPPARYAPQPPAPADTCRLRGPRSLGPRCHDTEHSVGVPQEMDPVLDIGEQRRPGNEQRADLPAEPLDIKWSRKPSIRRAIPCPPTAPGRPGSCRRCPCPPNRRPPARQPRR